MDYFDVHFQPFLGDEEHELLEIPLESGFDDWLEKAEAAAPPIAGTSLRVLLPPLYYQLAGGITDVRRLNDLMAAAGLCSGLAGAAAFGVVEPQHGERASAEVDRIAGILAGVVFSPRAQGVYGNTPELSALIRRAAGHGLITMVHVTANSGNDQLWRIWDLAEACGDAPMIALGALSGWENLQGIIANPGRARNLRYDTSGMTHLNLLKRLARAVGADRLLFGSGAHVSGHLFHRAKSVEGIAGAGLDATELDAVLFGNAERLLKITLPQEAS